MMLRQLFVSADIVKKMHVTLISLNLIMSFGRCSCSFGVSFLFGFYLFIYFTWIFFEVFRLVWP